MREEVTIPLNQKLSDGQKHLDLLNSVLALLRHSLGLMQSLWSDFSRGKGRTQISLVPRSLHRQNTPASKAENGTAAKQQDGMSDGQALDTGCKSMSNEDFARMVLKK